MEPRSAPNSIPEAIKNLWKFDAFPGGAMTVEILIKPKEKYGFSKVRGLAYGLVFGCSLVFQIARKIHTNSIGFLN